jgi:MFS family permease
MGAALFMISSVTSLSSLPFQYITPRHLRAQAIALMAMVAALFGTGLGPVIAGVVSDRLSGVRYPLSVALAGIGAVCIPVVILMILVVSREHARRRLDLAATTMTEAVA